MMIIDYFPLNNDPLAFCIAVALMLCFVESIKLIASTCTRSTKNEIPKNPNGKDKHLSNTNRKGNTRKVLHILAGPLFILLTTLLTTTPTGNMFACMIVSLMTIKFFLVGTGIVKGFYLVDSDITLMSRSGTKEELLLGPTFYGMSITYVTYLNWKSIAWCSGILALCLGDGFAEIVGTWQNVQPFNRRIPWNSGKSIVGTLACMWFTCFGIFLSFLVSFLLEFEDWEPENFGFPGFSSGTNIVGVAVIGGVLAGLLESVPLQDMDNVLVCVGVNMFVFSFTSASL